MDPDVAVALARPSMRHTQEDIKHLATFLAMQFEAACVKQTDHEKQNVLYLLFRGVRCYVGRAAMQRVSRQLWNGPPLRWAEHVKSLWLHRDGKPTANQKRRRYYDLLKGACEHTLPSMIVVDWTSLRDAAAHETALISYVGPTANNLRKTFGVRAARDPRQTIAGTGPRRRRTQSMRRRDRRKQGVTHSVGTKSFREVCLLRKAKVFLGCERHQQSLNSIRAYMRKPWNRIYWAC